MSADHTQSYSSEAFIQLILQNSEMSLEDGATFEGENSDVIGANERSTSVFSNVMNATREFFSQSNPLEFFSRSVQFIENMCSLIGPYIQDRNPQTLTEIITVLFSMPVAERRGVVELGGSVTNTRMGSFNISCILEFIQDVPVSERSTVIELSRSLMNDQMNFDDQIRIINCIKNISVAERSAVIELARSLINDQMNARDKICIINCIKNIPVAERSVYILVAETFFSDGMSVNNKIDIIRIIIAGSENPELDIQTIINFMRDIRNNEIDNVIFYVNFLMPESHEISFYDKIRIINCIKSIPINERLKIIELSINFIDSGMTINNKIDVINCIKSIPVAERVNVVSLSCVFIDQILNSFDVVNIIDCIKNIPVDERNDIIEVCRRFINPQMNVNDIIAVIRSITFPNEVRGGDFLNFFEIDDDMDRVFRLNLEDLKKRPEVYLEQFVEEGFPVRFMLIDNDGAPFRGIDAGGISKQVVTELIDALFRKNGMVIGELGIPQIVTSEDSVIKNYKNFGIFLSQIWEKNKGRTDLLLIGGDNLDPAFFELLKILSNSSEEEDVDSDMIRAMIDSKSMSANVAFRNGLNDMLESDINDLFQPYLDAVKHIFSGITDGFNEALRENSSQSILDRIQGVPVTAEKLIGLIQVSLETTEDIEQLHQRVEWIKEWILENQENPEILKSILMAITGKNRVGGSEQVKILISWFNEKRGVDDGIEIHTCFNSLEVPRSPQTKEEFINVLESAIVGDAYNVD